jgi:hypothetical protein
VDRTFASMRVNPKAIMVALGLYRTTMTIHYRELPREPEVIIGDLVKDGL